MVKINIRQAKFLGIMFLTVLTVSSVLLQNDYLLIPVLIVLFYYGFHMMLERWQYLGDKKDEDN